MPSFDEGPKAFLPRIAVKVSCILPVEIPYGYIESFNGKLRDECLNENWFKNLQEAKTIIKGHIQA